MCQITMVQGIKYGGKTGIEGGGWNRKVGDPVLILGVHLTDVVALALRTQRADPMLIGPVRSDCAPSRAKQLT
jgi:hypothetical protein